MIYHINHHNPLLLAVVVQTQLEKELLENISELNLKIEATEEEIKKEKFRNSAANEVISQ